MHLRNNPLLHLRSRLCCLPLGCVLIMGVPAAANSQPATPVPIPKLQHTGDQFQLLVDGEPYLILGGQAHNSSASNVKDAEAAYKVLDYMHANTAEIPISWNLIEPQPGKFDFTLVDGLIERARAYHLRLVFLWFGTAKNGTFSYVPDWVKQDRTKYFRARNSSGGEMNALSPFCEAAQMADEHAFAALMHHIRDFDTNDRTVILMQVENEVGLGGTDRDYSPVANRKFAEAVPADVMSYLSDHKETLRPAMHEAWQRNGFKTHGTWTEVLGDMGAEAFSAWAVSRYVDGVAAAGKTEYPLPFYLNVSLMNTGSARAGDWPSGGATAHVIDIWKANAPHIDFIAPDIYRVDFPEMVDIYDRPDNPLLVPETGFSPYYAPYVFTTLAGHNGLGFAPFGVDVKPKQRIDDGYSTATEAKDPEVKPGQAIASMEENFRVLRPLLPLIASKRYQNSLFPIVLSFYRHESVAIPLGDALSAVVHFDEPFVSSTDAHRAGGIIIKLSSDTFVVAGHGFHVDFEELTGSPRNAEYLTVEEGTYNAGKWVREHVLNGDEENTSLPTTRARTLLVRLNRTKEANVVKESHGPKQ